MRFPPPLVLLAVFVMLGAAPAFAEKAGTVSSLAALFAEDGALPRQNASVPISVHNGATFAAYGPSLAFAPNTFGTIYGPVGASSPGGSGSLVAETKVWNDSFVNGVAPTNLGGVRVRINGKDAFIVFTGLGATFGNNYDQVNFIAPDLDPIPMGAGVTVEVYKNDALVGSTTVSMDKVSPALFPFGAKDGFSYVAAVQANFEAYIAPTNLFSVTEINGIPIRPTRSGEIISLFGTGFGATDPRVPAGQITPGVLPLPELVDDVAIRIGGLPAQVLYAGLAPNLTGLYQFNVIMPTLSNGAQRVEIDIAGKSIQTDAFLPVQNP